MAAMAARSIWEGSISFGLMNIPIQVFSATSLVRMKKAPGLLTITDDKFSVEQFHSFIDKPYYVDRVRYID
jgi:hypothetical protein